MKIFMAIFLTTPGSVERSGWNKLGDKERQARVKKGADALMAWAATHREAIVVPGAELGKSTRIAADGVKQVANPVSGFVIVRAESHEAAVSMFANHPHFTIFPGDSVEIMQCMPPPGQAPR
ncbi:MAG: hypothetical protein DCF16_08320 [Alphaproteobacteria bacterium]|nr:MAG: hypothetical protein DCF16_08320 [Alphaproteobacteria bacterium]